MRFLLISLLTAPCVFAWGPGHDDVNRIALDRLPPDIMALLAAEDRNAFVAESHAPDDFTPWSEYEAKKGRSIAADDLATLAAHQIKTPYALHSAKGQAVTFVLLHRALKERDGDRIAFWGACLAHTLADEVACNHDPLIHYLTYAFQGYGMSLGEAGMLDFGQLCQTPGGYALAMKTLGDDPITPLADEPQKVLAEIMLHGLRANRFMTQRSLHIASAFDPDVSDATLANARVAIAELGVYGARAWLQAITSAWALIKAGKPDPVINKALLADHQASLAKIVAARPLAADALYAPWLNRQAEASTSAVGVVVEPSISMNKGGLSFGGRFLASAILRHLHESAIPFRLIDAREPGKSLSPQATSVAIICSGPFRNEGLLRALKTYSSKGGKILLIGGEHRGLLGPLSQALTTAESGTLPVTAAYGQNNLDYIDALRIRFGGPLAGRIGDKAFPFIRNPDTKSGWQKPKCPYRLKESQVVAALYRQAGSARYAFIPEYLVAPYLLTDEPSFTNPARPHLDRIGSALLSTVLEILR